jgi:hypothetical protein
MVVVVMFPAIHKFVHVIVIITDCKTFKSTIGCPPIA